ncbi:MAG: FKBP-type peptidyl-prolyl cis-trans isomerase [bacterium]
MSERAGQRIAAFALAGVFFFSSVALTGFVIWQIRKDSQTSSADTSNSATDTSAIKAADAARIKQQQEQPQNTPQEGKLKGTKLADFTSQEQLVTDLQKIDLVEGTGNAVATGAKVTVHYTGALVSNGIIFESSKDGGKPASFPLSGVIKGWQDGVPGMKVGGKRRLVIPYALAYGEAGSPPSIPAKSDLVFDIELISID